MISSAMAEAYKIAREMCVGCHWSLWLQEFLLGEHIRSR
jgi:hypothetical protein